MIRRDDLDAIRARWLAKETDPSDVAAVLFLFDELDERLEHVTRERDEARAQLAALDTGSPCDGRRHCCADRRRLAEELLRVRAERDALKGEP